METERAIGNEFEISLSVTLPYDPAMEEDDLSSTVSYADLYEIVKEEMAEPSQLLEKVAVRIATSVVRRFPVITGGTITIEKVRPPIKEMLGTASVTLTF